MLLDVAPTITAVGADMFADEIRAQAVDVTPVLWRPPSGGTEKALAAVVGDARFINANAEAARRLTSARPKLLGIATAGEALGVGRGEFLHAGPPIDWASASGPLRGALIGAMMYEGLASTFEEAEKLGPSIALAPCHSRRAVGPMAGVVSSSMPVFVVQDDVNDTTSYSTLNEGLGKVLRMGAYGPEVIERLRWLQTDLAPLLAETLQRHGPVDLSSILAQAIQMGDEAHNRNRAGTSLLIREIVADLVELEAASTAIAAALRFVNSNDHFLLNLAMAAAKASTDAGRDIPGSSLVVAMARNGTEFGIQTSGTGDEWFTCPCDIPEGLYFAGFGPEDANPDIGDSAIMETLGLGGFAMAASPAIVRFIGGQVSQAVESTQRMYEITLAEHPLYQIPGLDFRGSPSGVDATLVVRTGILPVIDTGIAGREAGIGQVGAGIVSPRPSVFIDAVNALAERSGQGHVH
jgi:Protein of unknown function (DUF1116)